MKQYKTWLRVNCVYKQQLQFITSTTPIQLKNYNLFYVKNTLTKIYPKLF